MGGIGSGRIWHWSAKSLTTDYLSLDVRRLARDNLLVPGRSFGWTWSQNGEPIGSIRIKVADCHVRLVYRNRSHGEDWETMDYPVNLISQPCNFGGYRKWFSCPARGCGRQVAVLYGGRVYACRQCYQLAYPSQREERYQRATRRSQKIEERLGWDGTNDWRYGQKPKWMHRKTFERLTSELERSEAMWSAVFNNRFAHLLSR